MRFYYITFRSVTYAQKAQQILNRNNITCTIQRTPRWMEAQGCGYALRIWAKEPLGAVNLLQTEKIPMRKLYLQRVGGELEELSL